MGSSYDEFAGGIRLRISDIARRLSNSALLHSRTTRNYQSRLARHRAALPSLGPADEAVAAALAARHIATRQIDLGTHARAAAQRSIDWLSRHNPAETVGYLPLSLLEDDPSLFLWGLAEENLDIAERHIGLPVRYLGLEVRAERAVPAGSRHLVRDWHLDVEDRRMLKVIVYLNDVDQSTGPFEFVGQAASDLARQTLRVRPGITFLPDADVTRAVPASDWHQVTGPAGTAVYVDTARLLHRIKAPTTGDRYSATFVYTSDRPRHALSRFMPPRHVVQSVLDGLTPRQRRALAAAPPRTEPGRTDRTASAKIAG
ncbi:hypothetical protein ACXPWS_14855 [Mycobacterium sp. BMJ-28]